MGSDKVVKKDIKEQYDVNIRLATILALLFFIVVFVAAPRKFRVKPYELKTDIATISEELPEELKQLEEPPPAERPKVAVEAENDEEAVNTIEDTDFSEFTRKATDVEVPVVPYFQLQVKPKPIYSPKPVYPELAKKAGIEGKVVVKALLDVDGSVIDVKLLKSSGNPLLDQAAIEAAYKWKFTPAMQRDQKVRVWMTIPFDFRLE